MPKGYCRNSVTTAGCRFGKDCRYPHKDDSEAEQSAARAKEKPVQDSDLTQWLRTIPKDVSSHRPLSEFQLTKFFQQAGQLVLKDEGCRQKVVERLASEGGLARLQECFELVTEEGLSDSLRRRVVLETLIPLFSILAREEVSKSWVLEEYLRRIATWAFGAGLRAGPLFRTSFNMLKQVFEEADGQCLDEPSQQHLLSFVAALSCITKFNEDAIANPDLKYVADALPACFAIGDGGERMHYSSSGTKAQAHHQYIQRRFDVIRTRNDEEPMSRNAGAKTTAAVSKKATFQLTEDGPGRLSTEGPRHDNDHDCITKVAIMPTQSELMSVRNEYLPRNDLFRLHLRGIEGLIDRQFRLLREDTVGQLRDAVKIELDRQQAKREGRPFPSNTRQAARTFVYKQGAVVDLAPHDLHGIQFTFRLVQPEILRNTADSERQVWWQRSKRLTKDTMVCLIDANSNALFARIISTRQQGDANNAERFDVEEGLYRNEKHAFISLALVVPDRNTNRDLFRRLNSTDNSETMVEFPGVLLASFKPTLEGLKAMAADPQVPFADIIAPMERSATEEFEVQPPAYTLAPGFRFDLSPVVSGDDKMYLSTSEPFDVNALRDRSTFDDGQASAVADALRRRIALIQGPPGTGKSYTGIALMKILLHNQEAADLGPILVVTFTNHALDQQLEHLVKAGVTNIVRVGARSKSELLQDVTLNRLRNQERETSNEAREFWTLREAQRNDTADLAQFIAAKRNIGSPASLKEYLGSHYPDHEDELFGEDEDEQGFRKVVNKRQDPVRQWLRPTEHQAVPQHPTRPLRELKRSSIYEMAIHERQTLHREWLTDAAQDIDDKIYRASDSYVEKKPKLDRLRAERDFRVLKQANVIGATTSGLANVIEILGRLSSKVLLCEEAGEVLEAHTLTALLPSIEHAILIGDHFQLRPSAQNYALSQENPRGQSFSLDVSLFERIVSPLQKDLARVPFSTLSTQRRMHPSISELVRSTLYPKLQDDACVEDYPEIEGMRCRLFWLDHDHYELSKETDEHVATSHSNQYEIEMTAAVVSHLVKQGKYDSSDIAVLTPYLGQLAKLRQVLGGMFHVSIDDRDVADLQANGQDVPNEEPSNLLPSVGRKQSSLLNAIRLATIDNFQGEEAKVVVISLVRSNAEGKCGFLRTSNRINVLLSRAMHGLYIIGNSKTAKSVPMWQQVLSNLEAQGFVGPALQLQCPRHPETAIEASSPDDFVKFAPAGGCEERCKDRLEPCGHACPSACHSKLMHDTYYCAEPCQKILNGCKHACPKACGDPCPQNCLVRVSDVELPCGHTPTLPCWEAQIPAKARCTLPVEKNMAGCDHTITVKCVNKDKEDMLCTAPCSAMLPCGHPCKGRCCDCRSPNTGTGPIAAVTHVPCKQPCGRPFTTCRHACTRECHGTGPCELCQAPCEVVCIHSACGKKCSEPCAPCAEETCDSCCLKHGKQCTMPCSAPCDWVPCSERCDKELSCGHQCPSICCEPCPSVDFCQACATAEIRAQCVDLVMMGTYDETDLDESPVIVLPCKHIFTVETLDGQMEVTKHYHTDADGLPVSVKNSSEPFSMDEMKSCPNCRYPLRSLRRYGRMVRRAFIDEATKKFIVWSNAQYTDLSRQYLALESGGNITTQQIPPALSFGVRLDNQRSHQFAVLTKRHGLQKLVGEELKLRLAIVDHARKVEKDEQPFKRVYNFVENKRRQGQTQSEFTFSNSVLQTRSYLLACGLLLRCELLILSKVAAAAKRATRATTLVLSLEHNRKDCLSLVHMAQEAKQPREEVEGHILLARFAALERSTGGKSSFRACDHTFADCNSICSSRRCGYRYFRRHDEVSRASHYCARAPRCC